MELKENINFLILLSSDILSSSNNTHNKSFMDKVERYLTAFDEFISRYENELSVSKGTLEEIEKLLKNHREVIDALENVKLKTIASTDKAKKNISKVRSFFSRPVIKSKKNFKT